ncbi:DUF1214 domain-containing protein [Marmoricola sp. RAF53]|uniref:DUF1214 domain-containing protein n=1 Tax=Marmoricola sp. RAF53 TaxID=3233059 RepID=UPI003F9961BF
MSLHVNVDNFRRAETDRMFGDIQAGTGGINQLRHNREPAPIDEQTVIRMNRDTLYSFAIVDISAGAELTLPDAGDRYLSAMVVNQDHYVNRIFHTAGTHALTVEDHGTPYVMIGVRTLVDPQDPEDVARVAAIQDQIVLTAGSAEPFVLPDYDTESFDATRTALLDLARNLDGFGRSFGTPEEVEPVRHLIATAAGWGGLPNSEAAYVGVDPRVGPGRYRLRMADVPVDAFWSVSVYNADGFFEPNELGRYTVNSVTGIRDADGAVTVRFSSDPADDAPNTITTPEGWNYLVRLYRPRPEIADGTWQPPALEPAPSDDR